MATAILLRLAGLSATDLTSDLREGRFRANPVDAAENETTQDFDGVASSRTCDDPKILHRRIYIASRITYRATNSLVGRTNWRRFLSGPLMEVRLSAIVEVVGSATALEEN